MGIPHDPENTWKLREIFRSALRITTGDQDARSGIRAMDFAHRIARLRISGGGYGAGIEHHHVGGFVPIENGPPGCAQGAAHRRSVRFGGATSKIFKREGSHELRADSTQGGCRKKIIAA
jgi:hypothetical protein